MKYIRHFDSQEDYEAFISSLTVDQTILVGGPEGVRVYKEKAPQPIVEYTMHIYGNAKGPDDEDIFIMNPLSNEHIGDANISAFAQAIE